jgi:hypothetical protein
MVPDGLDSSWGMTASLGCTCRPIAKCRLAADDAPGPAAYRRYRTDRRPREGADEGAS